MRVKLDFRRGLLGGSIVFSVLTAACTPDDQRTDSIDPATAGRTLPPAAVVQLDSGNAAYRLDQYETARAHYLRVTELAPGQAPGWFGLFMAETALGNDSAATAALDQARRAAPGASLLRVDARDTLSEGS